MANIFTGPQKLQTDPRYTMAQALMQNGQNMKVNNGIDGLNKVLSSFLAGNQMRKVENEYANRENLANDQFKQAMITALGQKGGLDPKTGITWDDTKPDMSLAIQNLSGNPDTAPLAQELMIKQIAQNQPLDEARQLSWYSGLSPEQQKLYQEFKGAGKGGNATIQAAQQLMAENPGLSFADAYSVAKSGLGQGMGMKEGKVSPLDGALDSSKLEKYFQQSGTNQANLEQQPEIERQKAIATAQGKELGDAGASLTAQEAQLPRLEAVVSELSDLGKKATYTTIGKATNAAARELGMEVPEGAVARTEYISKVDNEILPLLRQTFGAQFTEREGQSLKATLGDPDKAPEEKDAVLRSFIAQKRAQIDTLKRQTGSVNTSTPSPEQALEILRKRGKIK